ncbi:hypothetical protein [Mongoliitalea lutea]|uniref:Outer membrane protein beta-barrel domain-containing protein n=1 Tax=Mongoliitalea lutea TaxID=849756 RepID=A0A8J3CWA4_9BACT|nr:hypothetical protein [Mongoliitalea lutea]GHB34939.1 hypothetical protein GCM10008106_15360 [Mongoliitalea lutea]
MDRDNNFEKKIKQKLEEVHTPYTEDAWAAFAPMLDATVPTVPWWRRWFMPYAYSTLLFMLAWLLFPTKKQSDSNYSNDSILLSENKIDTVVLRNTVYIIDTLYVYRTVVVSQESRQVVLQEEASDNLTSALATIQVQEAKESVQKDLDYDSLKSSDSTLPTRIPTVSSQKSLTNEADSKDVKVNEVAGEKGSSSSIISKDSTAVIQNGYPNVRSSTILAAPSVAPEENFVMKLEKELVIGDTSNLTNSYDESKQKPFFNVEAGLSLLVPVSRNIDYYVSSTQSIQLGLEWESGWGIYAGAIRNSMKGEIDDDDIPSYPQAILAQLPGRPSDISIIDEIYVTNHQWFFPLELRWRSLYYSGFSFESSIAVVGNLLRKQEFQYEFEERLGIDDQFETLQKNQFGISHLKIGIGTNYLLSQRMGMYLRSHYWLPTSGTGLLQNRVHGMEIGVGLNYFFGK